MMSSLLSITIESFMSVNTCIYIVMELLSLARIVKELELLFIEDGKFYIYSRFNIEKIQTYLEKLDFFNFFKFFIYFS